MSDDSINTTTATILANRFNAITEEMGETMLRTSRSPIFSEARDFVTTVFDDDRWVANTGYIPVIAGSTPFAQKAIIENFEGQVHPGDVFIVNDSYDGGTHLADVAVTKPVFSNGKLRFWVMAKGHQADIGETGVAGSTPSATTIWEEGLTIPPLKLFEKGKRRNDVWEMIFRNIPMRYITEGDIQCLVGSVNIGEQRLEDLLSEHDYEKVIKPAVSSILKSSKSKMLDFIKTLPNGEYHRERAIAKSETGMKYVRLELNVKQNKLIFDFSDSDDECETFLNSPYPNTVSACLTPLWYFLDSDIPMDEGSVEPIEIKTKKGSIVDPVPPNPTSSCTTTTAAAIYEVGLLGLYDAHPEKGIAMSDRPGAPRSTGFNPRTGKEFSEIHFMYKGGGGATKGLDGWDHIGCPPTTAGLRAPDPELHELGTPHDLLRYEIWEDSAGPGKWRGGFGTVVKWRVETDDVEFMWFGSGHDSETVPLGLNQGGDAPKKKGFIERSGSTEKIDIEINRKYILNTGDIVAVYNSGGGGYGDPTERDQEKVLIDVLDGKISIESAAEDYGVVVNPNEKTIDAGATESLRGAEDNQ